MARNFQGSISATAVSYGEEALSCSGQRYINTYAAPYEMARYTRSAPNGVYPFFEPTFMAATRDARGRNDWFKRWHGSSQYIFETYGQPADRLGNDLSIGRGDARDVTREQAWHKFFEKLEGIDLSETLVQAGSVKRTVNLAETVSDLTKKAVGRFGLTRVISNGWMWANYGVKPLVNDMFHIIEKQSREVKKPFTIKAAHSKTFPVNANDNPLVSTTGKFIYRINCTFQAGAFDSVSQLTSMDPAYIAWTSLPWTFISDYFVNIGGYLREMELSALYNTAFLHGCTSEKTEMKGQIMSGFQRKTGWPCKDPYLQHHREDCDLEMYERGVLSSLPRPSFPKGNLNLGSSQLLNIAAALGSFLRS